MRKEGPTRYLLTHESKGGPARSTASGRGSLALPFVSSPPRPTGWEMLSRPAPRNTHTHTHTHTHEIHTQTTHVHDTDTHKTQNTHTPPLTTHHTPHRHKNTARIRIHKHTHARAREEGRRRKMLFGGRGEERHGPKKQQMRAMFEISSKRAQACGRLFNGSTHLCWAKNLPK